MLYKNLLKTSVNPQKVTILGENLQSIDDMRVGGTKCEHVVPSEDGTSATCVTTEEPRTGTAGDEPEDLGNCLTYTKTTNIVGNFPTSDIYTKAEYNMFHKKIQENCLFFINYIEGRYLSFLNSLAHRHLVAGNKKLKGSYGRM